MGSRPPNYIGLGRAGESPHLHLVTRFALKMRIAALGPQKNKARAIGAGLVGHDARPAPDEGFVKCKQASGCLPGIFFDRCRDKVLQRRVSLFQQIGRQAVELLALG